MADKMVSLDMKEHRELFWGGAGIPGDNRLFNEGGGIIFETDAEELEIIAQLVYDKNLKMQKISNTVLKGICVSISDDRGKSWRGCRVVSSDNLHNAKYPIFRYASRSPVYVVIFFPMAARVTDMELRLYGNKEIRFSPVKLKGRCLFVGGPVSFGAGMDVTYETLANTVMQNTLAEIFNNGKNTGKYIEYYMDGALMEYQPETVVMECELLKSENRRGLRELKNYIIHIRECSPESHLIFWVNPFSKDVLVEEQDMKATLQAIKGAVSGGKRVSFIDTKEFMSKDEKDIKRTFVPYIAKAVSESIMKDPLMSENSQPAGGISVHHGERTRDAESSPEDIKVASQTIAEALTRFEINAENVITADSSPKLEEALKEAGNRAEGGEPSIVYVPAGNYGISNKLIIPENVTLVAEEDSVFKPVSSDVLYQFFIVHGNVYGGTYDCQNRTVYGLRLGDTAFRRNNGIIERANVFRSKKDGIIAVGSNIRYACMYDNTISECGGSGIAAEDGAWVAVVSGNTCSANKDSGIKLTDANINIINSNVITQNGKYGIDTETQSQGEELSGCRVHKIVSNEITENAEDGVHIDKTSFVDVSFAKNEIRDNGKSGLRVAAEAFVKSLVKNRFDGNRESNIYISGEKSTVTIGNANVIQNSEINITASYGGIVNIIGDNNKIITAASHGILVSGGATLQVTGDGNRIAGNNGAGIMLTGKSNAKIINTVFRKNKGFAVRVEQGSMIDYNEACNLGDGKGSENRVYYN